MMKSWFLSAFILIATMAIMPICPGLGVEGVVFDADVAPGDRISHEMIISLRDGEAPMDLAVEVTDWNQSQDGVNQPDAMHNTSHPYPYSAMGFLSADPARLHVEPGESQKIAVKGDIPQDVGAGGRYALISIYGMPGKMNQEPENSVGISVAVNALVRLTISGSELIKHGEIIDANMDKPISGKHQNLSLIVRNTGNYHFKALAEAALRDDKGRDLAKSSSPLSSNILPMAERLFFVSLVPEQELGPGAYSVNATVRTEDDILLASKEMKFKL